MKLYEVSGKPFRANTQQGPKMVKQILICHRIQNEDGVKEYMDLLNEGVEILTQFNLNDVQYFIVKKIQALPFDLHGGSLKNLPKKK
jgi:hypothetical protein